MDCRNSNECNGICKVCKNYIFSDLLDSKISCLIEYCKGILTTGVFNRIIGHSALLIRGCSHGHIYCSYYELDKKMGAFTKKHFARCRDGHWFFLNNKKEEIHKLENFDFLDTGLQEALHNFLVENLRIIKESDCCGSEKI